MTYTLENTYCIPRTDAQWRSVGLTPWQGLGESWGVTRMNATVQTRRTALMGTRTRVSVRSYAAMMTAAKTETLNPIIEP